MIWSTSRAQLAAGYPPPEHPYFQRAYAFAQSWLAGQDEFVVHTSGSTGTPKAIRLSRVQLESSARQTGAALHLGPGTQALASLHVGYIGGLMMLVRALVLDWELTLREPVANPLLDLPGEMSFDFTPLVPLQLGAILANPSTQEAVGRLGKILLGGAPVSASLAEEIKRLNVPVYQSYGMTETVSHVALRALNGPTASEAYRLLEGLTYGTDARGCLYVAGAVTRGEVVQTNDRVALGPEGTFRWLGRADNIINSGGVKIQLEKVDRGVEKVLYELGRAEAFFCWHEPDEVLGQKLVLFVEYLQVPFPEAEVLSRLREVLSAYEVPKKMYSVPELIRTPTGKVDKPKTAAAFWASRKE
ncbi:AMP-binding protein [Rhabdobacter roseus]|uniref:O-succinylbenzoic acid--CoA ligase n=1 Tax=Rhabdobacter roseus TaxID=1655419 RepID=A0A840TP32_9BACT|nr:AMP-binding protein [Rhabdobacter roseus]MBB5283312.1 O-succinylbenzoic acid--CoA ligase [Rhabdobacter roseus]